MPQVAESPVTPVVPPPPRDPTADYAEGLAPGAGRPLVEPPAASVEPRAAAQSVNTFFAVGAVVLLLVTVVVVILLAVFVIDLLKVR